MSENFKNLHRGVSVGEGRDAERREAAVTAALTLIQSKVLNSGGATQLQWELSNLSTYADQIQEALKVNAE